mmetsp:Transcript_35171/g.87337  ORF Transcript_35171/g.87337 Transcript_35171/m.87337 type:complete len:226 (-) Transcript_35171:710-1387(-)
MQALVFLEASEVLPAPALHLVRHSNQQPVVDEVHPFNVAVLYSTLIVTWEVVYLPLWQDVEATWVNRAVLVDLHLANPHSRRLLRCDGDPGASDGCCRVVYEADFFRQRDRPHGLPLASAVCVVSSQQDHPAVAWPFALFAAFAEVALAQTKKVELPLGVTQANGTLKPLIPMLESEVHFTLAIDDVSLLAAMALEPQLLHHPSEAALRLAALESFVPLSLLPQF